MLKISRTILIICIQSEYVATFKQLPFSFSPYVWKDPAVLKSQITPWLNRESSYTCPTQRIFDVPERISILLQPGPKSVNTCAFWQSFPFHFEIMVHLPSCVERPPTKWLGQWRCWSRGSLAQHQEAPNLRSPSSKASDGSHAGLNFNHS